MRSASPEPSRSERWQRYLDDLVDVVSVPVELEASGRLSRVAGLALEATGVRVPVGAVCEVAAAGGAVQAEVVGFHGDRAYLMPSGEVQGLSCGAAVTPARLDHPTPRLNATTHPWRRSEDRCLHLPVGDGLLGRVVDAHGVPLDRDGDLHDVHRVPMQRRPINAMDREPIRQPLDTGVRAINAMLTVGRGQRIGLFAGTGVGKSVLLGMMARFTAADVIVVGLIGERGREVKEFIEDILGWDGPPGSLRSPPPQGGSGPPWERPGGGPGRARSVVVAAPADVPPIARMQAALYATTVAEHFRDQGKHVLLLMDSLTRYAMAQREIALAIGEPPATKGYPPSVFAKLPQLVERSGMGRAGQGSITAFYTVLSEGDDLQDPIADAARGILDGHIVLSRELAEAGHFPAIDVERSISRVMTNVVPREHQDAARRARALLARHAKARDLISLGAYRPGHDQELDAAVRAQPALSGMLQQGMHECAPLGPSVARLAECTRPHA